MNRELETLLASAAFHNALNRFLSDPTEEFSLFPWVSALSAGDRERLYRDLTLILAEPEETGESVDLREMGEILREYAEMAGWPQGALVGPLPEEETPYRVEVSPHDLRALEKAASGVRKAAQELLSGFLAFTPEDTAQIGGYRIKKMPERDVRQIDLPDDYRLRYLVDENQKVVYVVYLGPHPRGQADGRERAVRAAIHNRRREGG